MFVWQCKLLAEEIIFLMQKLGGIRFFHPVSKDWYLTAIHHTFCDGIYAAKDSPVSERDWGTEEEVCTHVSVQE